MPLDTSDSTVEDLMRELEAEDQAVANSQQQGAEPQEAAGAGGVKSGPAFAPQDSDPLLEGLMDDDKQPDTKQPAEDGKEQKPAEGGEEQKPGEEAEPEITLEEDSTDWSARAEKEGLSKDEYGEIRTHRQYVEAVELRDRWNPQLWSSDEYQRYNQFITQNPVDVVKTMLFQNISATHALNPEDAEDLAQINSMMDQRLEKVLDSSKTKLSQWGQTLYDKQKSELGAHLTGFANHLKSRLDAERQQIEGAESKINSILKSGELGKFTEGEMKYIVDSIFTRQHEQSTRLEKKNLEDPKALLENMLWGNPKTRQKMLALRDKESKTKRDTEDVNKALR